MKKNFVSSQAQFLNEIFSGADNEALVEVRLIGDRVLKKFFPINDLSEVTQYCERLNDQYNCFYGIATRDKKSGKKEDCYSIGSVYIDIDYGKEGHKKNSYFRSAKDVLDFLGRAKLGESIVVDSGNGFHLYWLLNKHIHLNSDTTTDIEHLNKQFAEICGGDSAYDISRIFRIPYTNNLKNNPPRQTSIVRADYSKRYDLEELKNHIKMNHLSQLINKLK